MLLIQSALAKTLSSLSGATNYRQQLRANTVTAGLSMSTSLGQTEPTIQLPDIESDPVGAGYTNYAPDTAGTYTIQAIMEQHIIDGGRQQRT